MSVGVSCNFLETLVNGNHIAVADVTTIVLYRQMLLPICGVVYVADVIASMLSKVADVRCHGSRWNGHLRVYLFKLSSEVLNRTSSHL